MLNLKRKKSSKSEPSKSITGFFPWQKDKAAEKAQNAEAMIAAVLKYLPQIKEILKAPSGSTGFNETQQVGVTIGSIPGQTIGKLYDFFVNYDGTVTNGYLHTPYGVNSFNNYVTGGIYDNIPLDAEQSPPQPTEIKTPVTSSRIPVNPKSVMDELEKYPIPELLENLDEKIATLKDKSLISNQKYVKAQIDALVDRLENRKRYKEFEDFFIKFPNTSDEKIDKLLSKYLLVMKTTELFVPTFPKEAIDVMKEYSRVTVELCGKEPVYYVIAEEKDFEKKYKKNDPILLVQSPFGFWWQVLGAWDKEMLLLHEL